MNILQQFFSPSHHLLEQLGGLALAPAMELIPASEPILAVEPIRVIQMKMTWSRNHHSQ